MILLIPYIEVQAANAAPTPLIVSAAPVMAFTLFAHNVGRHGGLPVQGVAVLHHDVQMLGEMFYGRFHPQQRRGAVFIDDADYPAGSKALSLQPTASMHLTVSLALRFDDAPDIAAIERFLQGARLAGGQIVSHGELTVLEDDAALLRAARTGYWLLDRSDLVDPDDPLESMLIRLRTPPAQEEIPEGRLPLSWLSGAPVGYAATTDFRQRAFVRDGDQYLHAFMEPLVGLVQFVSVRDYARAWGDAPPAPWWTTEWRDDVFIAREPTSRLLLQG